MLTAAVQHFVSEHFAERRVFVGRGEGSGAEVDPLAVPVTKVEPMSPDSLLPMSPDHTVNSKTRLRLGLHGRAN